ncbi:tyrosine-type recombinase/integrase [Paraburkholderia sp.]|uniref:tyrosine-type recombinase/integrase n=1 Tax=Paraburkholderia sp. TaxID=1926495 RepID=UPI00345DA968
MPLTDIEVRKSGPHGKIYRVRDGGGMFLEVRPNGSKYWRLKYRFGGKEKLLAPGTYPAVTLKEARGKREAAKKKIADGIDPSAAKQAEKRTRQLNTENSFEAIAREWHRKFSTSLSDSHAARNLRRLEVRVFPHIGGQPIGDVEPLDVLPVLQRIEKTGHIETAHRYARSSGKSCDMPSLPVAPNAMQHKIYAEPSRRHKFSISQRLPLRNRSVRSYVRSIAMSDRPRSVLHSSSHHCYSNGRPRCD